MLHTTYVGYRKIPKISPRAYFFYGGKFAFQNCLGLSYSRKEIYPPEPLMVNSSERRLKDKNLVLLSEMIK